jgi:hypothetical protein
MDKFLLCFKCFDFKFQFQQIGTKEILSWLNSFCKIVKLG